MDYWIVLFLHKSRKQKQRKSVFNRLVDTRLVKITNGNITLPMLVKHEEFLVVELLGTQSFPTLYMRNLENPDNLLTDKHPL